MKEMKTLELDGNVYDSFRDQVARNNVPRIGENGNWWTGDTDTGVSAGGSGGGSGDWELIATIITTETVQTIEITTDSKGEAFVLKDAGIKLDRTYTNPGSTALLINATAKNANNFSLAYISSMSKVTQYFRKFYSNSFVANMFSTAADGTSEVGLKAYICTSSSELTAIQLKLTANNIMFPIGTKVELWGVRA